MSEYTVEQMYQAPLYEEVEAGNHVFEVTGVEFKSFTSEEGAVGKKIVVKTKVTAGKSKGRSMRAEFLVDMTAAPNATDEKRAKSIQAEEIGRKNWERFVHACGWVRPNPKTGRLEKRDEEALNSGLAKLIDPANGWTFESIKGSTFYGIVGKDKSGERMEFKTYKPVSAANVGDTVPANAAEQQATTPPF